MNNQFFYTRTETATKDTPERNFLDSFDVNKVVRTLEMENGTRLVLLNDIHERLQDAPQFDKTRTKVIGYTKQRNTFQSEIYLSKEDSGRFVEQFNK